jgi:hypothetical protein
VIVVDTPVIVAYMNSADDSHQLVATWDREARSARRVGDG